LFELDCSATNRLDVAPDRENEGKATSEMSLDKNNIGLTVTGSQSAIGKSQHIIITHDSFRSRVPMHDFSAPIQHEACTLVAFAMT